ncbi:MAG: cysteine synthase A [Bacteroidales bacterium]
MRKENILELVGSTPSLRVNKLFGAEREIWIKLERQNPAGSIKDRIALAMITGAEKRGELKGGDTIIEPTSGNTGIGLAMVSAVKGYKLVLVMPDSLSPERRKLMQAYGARIVLTPGKRGMKGSIEKARELRDELGGWIPMQFENPDNPGVHMRTTAREIMDDFPDGLDYIITGVGTGGHISGLARELKKHWADIKILAVEPDDSPVISGGEPGSHGIQGIGAGFIPANLDLRLLDGVIRVSKDKAYEFARRAAREEGLLVGISTGASLAAIAGEKDLVSGRRVLTFAYDTGERYLSAEGLFNI